MTKNNWGRLLLALVASGLVTKAAEIALKKLLSPYYSPTPFLWSNIKNQGLILIPFFFNIQKIDEKQENPDELSRIRTCIRNLEGFRPNPLDDEPS